MATRGAEAARGGGSGGGGGGAAAAAAAAARSRRHSQGRGGDEAEEEAVAAGGSAEVRAARSPTAAGGGEGGGGACPGHAAAVGGRWGREAAVGGTWRGGSCEGAGLRPGRQRCPPARRLTGFNGFFPFLRRGSGLLLKGLRGRPGSCFWGWRGEEVKRRCGKWSRAARSWPAPVPSRPLAPSSAAAAPRCAASFRLSPGLFPGGFWQNGRKRFGVFAGKNSAFGALEGKIQTQHLLSLRSFEVN